MVYISMCTFICKYFLMFITYLANFLVLDKLKGVLVEVRLEPPVDVVNLWSSGLGLAVVVVSCHDNT